MIDVIISIWSMSMFSLYFSLNVGKILILYNIAIVYSFMSFLVAYRVYKWWKVKKTDGAERKGVLLWLFCWYFVVLLFSMKEIDVLSDIGMISAVWLFFVLLTTIMTSCYVIMNDSSNWTNQIFNVCVLHWVLSHNSSEWLTNVPTMLIVPIVCIMIIRIANHIENKDDPRHTTFEMLVWIVIFAFELAYDLKLVQHEMFYAVVFFMTSVVLVSRLGKKITILSYLSGLITPLLVIYIMYKVRKLGWENGLSEVWWIIDKRWKPKEPAVRVDESEDITDDML